MENMQMEINGNILTIKVDLDENLGPSKSGKTVLVATSKGNKKIEGREEMIGLNIFRKA